MVKMLSEHLQMGFMTSKDEFCSQIPKDAIFKPYGELVHSYSINKGQMG